VDENATQAVDCSDGTTMFTDWIYDHLKPHAVAPKVAHPLMLRAIAAAKKKNDRIDAEKICDALRCDFLPESYMVSTEIRERRRTLRYRNLLVQQAVQLKNRISCVLMQAGVTYNQEKLHHTGYFKELLATNPDIDESLRRRLQQCREALVRLRKTEGALVRSLERDPFLAERVERLMSIPAVGPITALTWALEVGDVKRFSSIKKGHQLLWAVWRREEFRRHPQADSDFQAAQQASTNRVGGGRQDGPATESGTGATV
jgi:transposase